MTTIASFHCTSVHQPHFTYHMPNKNIAIIGGGAAGCFAAIHIKTLCPTADVTVYEGGSRLLAKVAITGGGRCNLTNSFNEVKSMETAYPRGARLMKRLMRQFDHHATCQWFEQAGVPLVTQDDQCVFPASQDAMQIVHTLQQRMAKLQVKVKTGHRLRDIENMGKNRSPATVPDECDAVCASVDPSLQAIPDGNLGAGNGVRLLRINTHLIRKRVLILPRRRPQERHPVPLAPGDGFHRLAVQIGDQVCFS